jgi:hypothetical protein
MLEKYNVSGLWYSDEDIHSNITNYICNICTNIMEYFPNINNNNNNRVQNPFNMEREHSTFLSGGF